MKKIITTLTDNHLKNFELRDKPYIVREKPTKRGDGTFSVKVHPAGQMDFYFIYTSEGKEKQKKIGRYGKTANYITLRKARDAYREISAVYSSGVDPKEAEAEEKLKLEQEKLRLREIARKKQMQGSLEQLSEFFINHLQRERSKAHYNSVRKSFNKDLGVINLSIKASDVRKGEIIQILHNITTRGSLIQANRMRSYLSAMFQYGLHFDDSVEAISEGVQFFIENNPVLTVQKIVKNEKAGERFLNESEIAKFWQALELSNMDQGRKNVFKLMLILGCRVEAIAGLQWSEIDASEKLITFPRERTKNKLVHVLPINDLAMHVLNNVSRSHDVYLFPAKSGEGYLHTDGFSQAITRLLTYTEIDKFVPRDLRRTFKTLTGKAGISKDTRDRIQNHSITDVSSQHYDRYDYLTEKRGAMERWGTVLNKIICCEKNPYQ